MFGRAHWRWYCETLHKYSLTAACLCVYVCNNHRAAAAMHLQSSAGDETQPHPILGKGTTLLCGES